MSQMWVMPWGIKRYPISYHAFHEREWISNITDIDVKTEDLIICV